MLGPVIGSIIYTFCGFMYTFIAFGFLISIGAILIYKNLPNALNSAKEDPLPKDKENIFDESDN